MGTAFLGGGLGKLWAIFAPEKPPQWPEMQRAVWAYAMPGANTPPGLVILAEYDNQRGYFTLTRRIMDKEKQCLRPLQPGADQPESLCTRERVIQIFDQLSTIPENIQVSDRLPFAQHYSECHLALKNAFAPQRRFDM